MFEDIFRRKAVRIEKLLQYGFEPNGDSYLYSTDILNGQFRLFVNVTAVGKVDTKMIELENGEEYVLYKTSAAGAFVGIVRSACESVLIDISEKCFDLEAFKSEQARSVIRYVREKYGVELEFLWQKFPDNAVWRRKDNSKWYGALLTVSKSKLGLESSDIAEIIDLRYYPDKLEDLLSENGYYLGWHMNKKNWYTIILDSSIPDEKLFELIDVSYELALK